MGEAQQLRRPEQQRLPLKPLPRQSVPSPKSGTTTTITNSNTSTDEAAVEEVNNSSSSSKGETPEGGPPGEDVDGRPHMRECGKR